MGLSLHPKLYWTAVYKELAARLRTWADMLAPLPPLPSAPPPTEPEPSPTPVPPEPVPVPPPPQPDSEPQPEPEPPSPLDNKPWLDVAEECVAVFDEFDHLRKQFPDSERCELCEHVCVRLREVLERSGVEVIETDGPFDRRIHQPQQRTAITGPTAPLVHIVSPGFRIDRRVLRRALVEIVQD